MPDLAFEVTSAEAVANAASPTIAFRIHVRNASVEPIRSISLRSQIRIESPKRRYAEAEREQLVDLFAEPSRWGQTLKSLLWANAGIVTGPFEGSAEVELPVSCTFDFNVAVTKYFNALEGGEAPLRFLFSGSVFYTDTQGALQVEQIPWSRESSFRLPVRVWKEMMQIYYPNTAWLCLRKDVFDRLHAHKMRQGLPTWEEAIESILP